MHYCNMYIYLSNYIFIHLFIYFHVRYYFVVYILYNTIYTYDYMKLYMLNRWMYKSHTIFKHNNVRWLIAHRNWQRTVDLVDRTHSDFWSQILPTAEFLAPIRSQLVRCGQGVSSADREAWGTCCLRFMIAGCHEKGVNTRRCATKSKVYAGFHQSRPAVWDTQTTQRKMT